MAISCFYNHQNRLKLFFSDKSASVWNLLSDICFRLHFGKALHKQLEIMTLPNCQPMIAADST